MEAGNITEEFPAITFPWGSVGSIGFPILITVYAFLVLSIVCDEYFVPCIQTLCKKLSLSEDVAAATLMAAGINAPELFTNLISTFYAEADIGTGTVVGSGVFNVLAIPSVCILVSGMKIIQLKDFPLTRDSLFYVASVTILAYVIQDGKVSWYESLAMLMLYSLYILVMKYNLKLIEISEECIGRRIQDGLPEDNIGVLSPLLPRKNKTPHVLESGTLPRSEIFTEIPFDQPRTWDTIVKMLTMLTYPVNLLLKITIPSCHNQANILLILTFFMCGIWMALLTYVIIWMITILGMGLNIPHAVMGITFIAAGLSIPELVSSVIVAKQGLGSMALSNTIGSSIFGILVCMGLPWFLDASLIRSDHFTPISSAGLDHSLFILVISILIMYLLFCCNNFKLDMKIGLACLIMYALFITLFIYTEVKF
uniref:Sodium/potassium/calcium exchanger 5 n=1 Tax=Cacopsylla melanoneura TaxID=428564 RepID=A0A8D9ABV2_9HEMI